MKTLVLKERLSHELENFREIEARLGDPTAIADPAELKQLSREHARLNHRAELIEKFLQRLDQLEEAKAILDDSSSDREMRELASAEVESIEVVLTKSESEIIELLIPPDENSGKNLILEIRAGTGGDEAALFVGDLYRMYLKFTERHGLRAEQLSIAETEMGGAKEVVFGVSGPSAYDLLHREGGAHRVQRIPVTESSGRIHTSAVTVAVMPEAEEEEIEINEKDIRVDVYRASGAGGQHVNKTDSAVRMHHLPSGIVVTCQDERSQIKNRAKAMRILRTKLMEQQEQERASSEAAAKREQVGSGDRSERIRTYNFPQGRVTDHRIGYTAYNLGALMEGEMDELLEALRQAERDERLKQLQK